MTENKTFKRRVRTRMEKTGERYTTARAALLNGNGAANADGAPPPAAAEPTVPDATIRR